MSRSRSRSPERGAARDFAPPVVDESAKLFVGNLSFETQERDLEEAFSRYGKVVEARVITDRETGRPRGFGFVTFEAAASAEDAVTGMSGFELQGREIRVDRSTPRGSAPRRDAGYGGDRGGFGGGGDRQCHDFQKGNCSYGDRCKFSHGDSGGGGGGRPRYDDRGSRGYDDRAPPRDSYRGGRDEYRDDRRGGRDDYRGGGRDEYRSGGRDEYRGGGRDEYRGGGGRDYDDRRGGRGGYDDRAAPRY